MTLTDTGSEPLVGTVMFTDTVPGGGGGELSCGGGGLSCGDACRSNKRVLAGQMRAVNLAGVQQQRHCV